MSGAGREDRVREVFESVGLIAVLGAHVDPVKPAFYVPDYMHREGYHVVPVNPVFAGRELWGEPFRATLAEVEEPIDLVDVFRRSELVAGHAKEILALEPLPRWVWLQLGVRDDAVAKRLVAAGIEVIQDHCLMADHRRLSDRRSG